MNKIGNTAALFFCLLPFTFGGYAQGVAAPYTPRLQTFTTGLSRPILLRSAKDGTKRIFIVQQGGLIKVFQPGASTATTFIDLSSKIIIPGSSGDERGLLGMTFHPQFASNGKFYVNYTQVGTGTTVVAEYTTVAGNPNLGDILTERILFTVPQPFANHNGGMVEFGPDGYLYIGMGDGGSANDPGLRAQNRAQLLGKMLRIDPNVPIGSAVPYLIPPTNPFTGANTTRCDNGSTTGGNTCQELWTIGMRNPWRWSFDRGGTNQLYVADVGQDAIEELDIITGGGNYGWRVYEGNQCTGLDPALCSGGATPITQIPPYFTYTHSAGRCSVTGGYVYRGTQASLPVGAYTFADYCTGEIWMWYNNAQILLQDTPRQVVSFGEDEDGEIYVCYSNGQIDKITRARASGDLDGDLKSDIAIYRPTTGVWWAINSSNGSYRVQQFGGAQDDIITPEDFDGDNIVDVAFFRPSNGTWNVFRSSDNTIATVYWGTLGDVPAAGDYDGDAKADYTVYRPSTGVWYTLRSMDGQFTVTQYGLPGDTPVAGDYDGDGKYDIAVFRDSTGVWYRINSSNGAYNSIGWGLSNDLPAPGDFDGDGKLDITVYRRSNGVWYTLLSSTGGFQGIGWGISGDVPAIGDYDGDGKEDIAVYRPSTGVWYGLRSSNGSVFAIPWGLSGDVPIEAKDNP